MNSKKLVDTIKDMVTKDKREASVPESFQARIIISTLSYNNLMMIMDENGECHKPPIPDPIEEELLVKIGDQVNGFEVLALTSNFIELKSFIEYTADHAPTPTTHFVIEKGECINLNMYGVYDAVHKTSIKYVEAVRLTKEDI